MVIHTVVKQKHSYAMEKDTNWNLPLGKTFVAINKLTCRLYFIDVWRIYLHIYFLLSLPLLYDLESDTGLSGVYSQECE